MTVDLEFIKNIPYFSGLNADELQSVKKVMVKKTAERGEIIIMDGTPARKLFFLVSGAVKIFKTSVDGKEQIFRILRQGDSFNEVPVFDNGLTPVSAEAMTVVVLYEIDRDSLDVILRRFPYVARNVIRILAERIRSLVSLVEDLSFRNVVGRVAKILYETASDHKATEHRLTQQEMAAMAGTAREVVGRSLKSLEEEGIISLDRHRILIKNKEALRQKVMEVV
ncbi:MAG TPA: Crp/Fnr family transcriptional regulator [Dehalococcoidia bacterium]|nr:Crp/Fnr family transcriptional regulator [Dehalococcoidia bacterium]